MTAVAIDLAYRTAATAGPFVDSLAGDVVAIALALRDGDLEDALEAFETSTERLHRFLTFLVVATELMIDTQPSLGAVIADYSRRLLEVVGNIEAMLEEGDLVGFAVTLEHSLARSLWEYAAYDPEVRRALAPAASDRIRNAG